MEINEKMQASPLYKQSREDCESSTQADLRKSLMSSSSQEPSAPGELAALFSLRGEEPETQFKSSVFKNADPSNLGRSLLEGNKDHCLVRQVLKL